MSPRKPKLNKNPTSKSMKAARASRPVQLPHPGRRPTFRAQGVSLPSTDDELNRRLEEQHAWNLENPDAEKAARAFIAEHGTRLCKRRRPRHLRRRRVQAEAPKPSDMTDTNSMNSAPSSPSSDASLPPGSPSTPPQAYVFSRTTPPPAPRRYGRASGAGLFAGDGQPKGLDNLPSITASPKHDAENRGRDIGAGVGARDFNF